MATRTAASVSRESASTELANAALSCAPLARALKLARWVGPGKALTSNDVLRPAEATQACRDLGIEFLGNRLRSALDVDELIRDWNTALVAGFLRIAGRRASAAADLPDAGSSAHRDPEAILDGWVQAATFFLDLDEDPCPGCLTVLHTLRLATGPVTMRQLAIAVREAELEAYEDGPCPGCGQVHGQPELPDFGALFGDQEEDQEVVDDHAVDTVFGMLEFDAVSVGDEAVRLTQLGVLLAESVFEGRAVPPDADAATVISAITDLPLAVARVIAAPWLSARSASGAVRELLAFAESERGRERLLAVAFAAELGQDAADEWREWAKRPGFGAYAREWLRSEGEVVTEEPADGAWIAADAFCVTVDAFAEEVPPFMLRDILAQQLGGDVSEAVEVILRSGHHRAPELVAALTGRPVLTAVNGSACR